MRPNIFLAFALILLFQCSLLSQSVITGKVLDENAKALPNINILVYPHNRDAMIAFGVSNNDGAFSIRMTHSADSLKIIASSMHYRNDTIYIANKSQEITLALEPEVKELKEFVLKASPIIQRGDTISYLVSSFAGEADRSIADVLERMPGIQIESSGRILYQGDPIQHLYVEGLDLMGGRYGLVSNNLPHQSVSTVEVLENHQPIRILEDMVPSYRASLNIRLKNNVATTGTADIGSGLTPFLWDANITPMMFTRKFQVAGSYQANNSGNDVSRQLNVLSMENVRDATAISALSNDMLSIPNLSPPDFNQRRYLENNIHLANANSLTRLSNDLQLRTNLYYIYDVQQQEGLSKRTIYTPTDTLEFAESIYNNFNHHYLQGEFTLNRNTKDNYLNNRLNFKTNWDKHNGSLMQDNDMLNQNLHNPFYSASNRLVMIKPIKNRLVEFTTYLLYDQNPQTLVVSPGVFENLFNPESEISEIHQDVNLQRMQANQSISFSTRWKNWTISPRLGFQYKQNNLNSRTHFFENGIRQEAGNFLNQAISLEQLDDDVLNNTSSLFKNTYEGYNTRTYVQAELNYKTNHLSLTANAPVSHVYYSIEDKALNKGQSVNSFVVDPRFTIDYKISAFWRTRGTYSFNNLFGELEEVHYAYILKNYRILHLNDAPLSRNERHNFSAFLSYRNPIESFFSSINYNYSVTNNTMLFNTVINDDGTSMVAAVEVPNTSYAHNVFAQTSKFFSPIRSTIAIQAHYSRFERMQLVNDFSVYSINNIYSLNPRLSIRFTQWLNAEYRASFMYYDTYHAENKINDMSVIKNFLDFLIFPARNQFISIKGEYYMHEDKHNYFVDLHYRYTIRSRRIDLEARWINILNNSSYQDFYVGAYSLVENYYVLRPTQFILSVKFSF